MILPCGGTEPIDELVVKGAESSIPMSSLAGWVSRRFDGSASISLNVSGGSDRPDDSLAGTVGGPFPTSQGPWIYISVFSQKQEFVALPLCPEADWPAGEDLLIVDMLSEQQAVGKGLGLGKMARAMKGSWGGDLVLTGGPQRDDGE